MKSSENTPKIWNGVEWPAAPATRGRNRAPLIAALQGLSWFAAVATFNLLSALAAESGAVVEQSEGRVRVTWPISLEESGSAVFSLDEQKPLIEALGIAAKGEAATVVATALNPVTLLTVGSRDSKNPQGWGAFFDNTPRRPYETFLVALGKRRAQVTNNGTRTTVNLAEVSAGGFRGDVQFTFYRNSPLIHAETVMTTQEDWRAIVYDAGLMSAAPSWESMAWNDTDGQFQNVKLDVQASAAPLAVAGRTIVASGKSGSLAIFPPPHQFFYPQDEAYNLKFVWHGRLVKHMAIGTFWYGFEANDGERVNGYGFGIRQSATGDRRFVPWFNAPPGTEQRLGAFYLLTRGDARQALEAVARYTHADRFKKLPGHLTFTSHYHVEHSRNFLDQQKKQQTNGVPRGLESPGFVKTFKARGVDIAHLAEFHYEAGSRIPEAERLHKLKVMHDELRRLSDRELLLLPGEEPNVQLGGHWISLFPKPVNWTLNRPPGKPFVEEIAGHGRVYHAGSPEDVLRLFQAERGLMWTAHPRIKSSFGFPDKYKETEFFRSDRFLGGAWKAMPADLSRPTLGWRVLDLLDDMSNWGAKKQVLGEVDTFRMDPDFETYGHMNINYLRLAQLPRYDEGWQPVLDALRGGEFFTTTGEVLIPEFTVGGKASGETLDLAAGVNPALDASLEWTFPLAFAEVISGDGQKVFRQRIDLADTECFGNRKLRFPLDLKGRTWVRFEVWDIASNGAFTQPVWIERARGN
ncbi:MAG: hypothetical protein L0Z50_33385 [Verrucomicrobiales bacterium]|nr:hypothetical protein [Verrucomicrobiales bacterium]